MAVVQAFVDTWNAGDMDAVRELLDPDVIVRPVSDWPEPGPYMGREAAMGWYEPLRETFDADTVERRRTSKHSGRCTPLWPPGTSRRFLSCAIPALRSPNHERFPTPRAFAAITAFVLCSRSSRTFFQTCNSRQLSSSLTATGCLPRRSGSGQALEAERVLGSRSFTSGPSRRAAPLEFMHFLIAGRPSKPQGSRSRRCRRRTWNL